MNPVHCAGCKRRIGYSVVQFTGRIWCSQVCTYLPGPTGNEDRDDVVFLLYQLGKPPSDLARMLGVSVGRIHQIKNREQSMSIIRAANAVIFSGLALTILAVAATILGA